MPRLNNRHDRRRRGSAVMEAALVFPFLIALTMGAIECGYFYFIKHTLQGAAREGARAAIVPGATNADVTAAVDQTMKAAGYDKTKGSYYTVAIRNANDDANLDVANATAATGILVRVNTTWDTVKPMSALYIDKNKAVVGKTVMRKEG